jgi:hypothetical protein
MLVDLVIMYLFKNNNITAVLQSSYMCIISSLVYCQMLQVYIGTCVLILFNLESNVLGANQSLCLNMQTPNLDHMMLIQEGTKE